MDTVDSWLVKMAAKQPTDVARLESAMNEMSIDDLVKLAQESKLQEQRSETEDFLEKVAAADRMGRELAHKYGGELLNQVIGEGQEKTASQYGYGNPYDDPFHPAHTNSLLLAGALSHPRGQDQTYEMGRGRMTPEERTEDDAVDRRGGLRTLGGAALGAGAGALLGRSAAGAGVGALLGLGAGGLYHHMTEGKGQRDKLREAAYNRPTHVVTHQGSMEKQATNWQAAAQRNAGQHGPSSAMKKVNDAANKIRNDARRTGSYGGSASKSSGRLGNLGKGVGIAAGVAGLAGAGYLAHRALSKEKQAGVLSSLGGLAQKATAMAVRHPTAALGVAGGAVGAGVGAATAKPGEGLSGALTGGAMGAGLGAGAGALGAGQALRKGVLGTGTSKPMLGEGAKNYAVEAMKANPVSKGTSVARQVASSPVGGAFGGGAAPKIAPTAPNADARQMAASLKKSPSLAQPGAGKTSPAGWGNRRPDAPAQWGF